MYPPSSLARPLSSLQGSKEFRGPSATSIYFKGIQMTILYVFQRDPKWPGSKLKQGPYKTWNTTSLMFLNLLAIVSDLKRFRGAEGYLHDPGPF